MLLTRIEQKNGHLAQVEIDEVFGFMCHMTTKVLLHDSVPGGLYFLSNSSNMHRDILLYVIFLQHPSSTFHGVLLHLPWHIGIFDHRLWSHMVTVEQG